MESKNITACLDRVNSRVKIDFTPVRPAGKAQNSDIIDRKLRRLAGPSRQSYELIAQHHSVQSIGVSTTAIAPQIPPKNSSQIASPMTSPQSRVALEARYRPVSPTESRPRSQTPAHHRARKDGAHDERRGNNAPNEQTGRTRSKSSRRTSPPIQARWPRRVTTTINQRQAELKPRPEDFDEPAVVEDIGVRPTMRLLSDECWRIIPRGRTIAASTRYLAAAWPRQTSTGLRPSAIAAVAPTRPAGSGQQFLRRFVGHQLGDAVADPHVQFAIDQRHRCSCSS